MVCLVTGLDGAGGRAALDAGLRFGGSFSEVLPSEVFLAFWDLGMAFGFFIGWDFYDEDETLYSDTQFINIYCIPVSPMPHRRPPLCAFWCLVWNSQLELSGVPYLGGSSSVLERRLVGHC